MSAAPKIVTVIGATGAQGGSVVHHLLKSGKFKVRAVTRKPGDDKAKALAAQGVEVVAGNAADKASLVKAFSGSWGVFAVTQFWDPEVMKSEGKLELEHGLNIVAAATEAKVQFAVASTLDDVEEASAGRLHVPHFTNKAKLEPAWKKSGIPTAFVRLGCYMQNLLSMMAPKPGKDGVTEFVNVLRHDVGVPFVNVEDTGLVARTLFESPSDWAGKAVDLAPKYVSYPEVAEIWSRVHSKPARYVHLPYEVFQKFAGAEVTSMFQYFNEFGYFRGRDLSENRKRWPALSDIEAFFRAQTDR